MNLRSPNRLKPGLHTGELPTNETESGIGLPHSKTLSRQRARHLFREVLECGCPLPLSLLASASLRRRLLTKLNDHH
jgi:hypothetical protein